MIDLHNGRVTDQIKFKSDKIFLSHNQGLYLYNNTLAILSGKNIESLNLNRKMKICVSVIRSSASNDLHLRIVRRFILETF